MNDELLPIRAVADNSMHKPWADWAGMIASIGCAIHCAAMPLVLAYLPAFGLEWLADEGFHRWMAAICFALAAAAFAPGWRKHRSLVPAMWGAVGLLLLTAVAFGLEGACCAGCSTDSSSSDFVATQPCGDATYPLCQSGQEVSATMSKSGNWFALLTPFVTPLGGLLLVVGHVSNHRRNCRCQKYKCCLG